MSESNKRKRKEEEDEKKNTDSSDDEESEVEEGEVETEDEGVKPARKLDFTPSTPREKELLALLKKQQDANKALQKRLKKRGSSGKSKLTLEQRVDRILDDTTKLKTTADLVKTMHRYRQVMDDKEESWENLKPSFDKHLNKIKHCEDLVKMSEKLDEMWQIAMDDSYVKMQEWIIANELDWSTATEAGKQRQKVTSYLANYKKRLLLVMSAFNARLMVLTEIETLAHKFRIKGEAMDLLNSETKACKELTAAIKMFQEKRDTIAASAARPRKKARTMFYSPPE